MTMYSLKCLVMCIAQKIGNDLAVRCISGHIQQSVAPSHTALNHLQYEVFGAC